jgi:hypothetical protein
MHANILYNVDVVAEWNSNVAKSIIVDGWREEGSKRDQLYFTKIIVLPRMTTTMYIDAFYAMFLTG